MYYLSTIVATLSLCSLNLALTPGQVEQGRIEGFTSGHESTYGSDFLLSSFCFCAAKDRVPNQQGNTEANYLEFDYYNKHRNMTFVLDHLCLGNEDSDVTCLNPRLGDGIAQHKEDGVDWQGPTCRKWYRDTGDKPEKTDGVYDELCYHQNKDRASRWRENRIPQGPDTLIFNGEKRHLDKKGQQGPILWRLEEAETHCQVMCQEHAGMDVLTGHELAQSHVVEYEDLDDMCGKCK